MYAGRTLHELATELERQSKSKRDFVVDTRKLKAIPTDGGVLIEGINGGMRVGGTGHQQIGSVLQIPRPYYDRMLAQAPDLLADNINHWFAREPKRRLVRTLDGKVRAFLSEKYRPLDNLDLAEAVLPKLSSIGAEVVSGEVTEDRFFLKATTERIKGEVVRGDTVQAGIVVSNSEVGMGSLRIEELIWRCVCANGAIMSHTVRKNHLGRRYGNGDDAIEDSREWFRDETRKADDRAFFLKVQDATAAMFTQERFDARLISLRDAKKEAIEAEPEGVVELTAKRFGLQDGERGSVLKHLLMGGDLSKWGLTNAVTRASQDAEDYRRATELEALGGQIVELSRDEWRSLAT